MRTERQHTVPTMQSGAERIGAMPYRKRYTLRDLEAIAEEMERGRAEAREARQTAWRTVQSGPLRSRWPRVADAAKRGSRLR